MNNLKITSDEIKKSILGFIGSETKRVTPVDVSSYCKTRYKIPSKTTKKYIKSLISSGALEYTTDFGRTFIDISFSKPVKISDRIILIPPFLPYKSSENEVYIVIEKGVSFGRGTHPTTRLCLQAIDLFLNRETLTKKKSRALDIGTGSGVLVMAGVLLGISSAFACDLDSISVNEARNNISHNKLSDKITVDKYFNPNEIYDFLFANLRYPTLIDLFDSFLKMTKAGSLLFLSGIKIEEKEIIISKYIGLFFDQIFEKSESGWICFVFKRKQDVEAAVV